MMYKEMESIEQHAEICHEFKSFNADEQSDCDDE